MGGQDGRLEEDKMQKGAVGGGNIGDGGEIRYHNQDRHPPQPASAS